MSMYQHATSEIELQLNEAVNIHEFRRVVQDGRPAIEKSFRVLFAGKEEVVRTIIQPDSNPNTPPRFWCPGASSADSAANSELYELTYRKNWTSGSNIAGLAAAITDTLCSRDLYNREPNPRYAMTRGSSFDSATGYGSPLFTGHRNVPTVHGSTHTAPHPSLPQLADGPVINRSRTTMLDSRGAPVIYSDTTRRPYAASATDLDQASQWGKPGSNAGRHQQYMPPTLPARDAGFVSGSSAVTPSAYSRQLSQGGFQASMDDGMAPHRPPGHTSSPPEYQADRQTRHTGSGNSSGQHSGPHGHSGPHNASGPINTSGPQSHVAGDYGRPGGSDQHAGGGGGGGGGGFSDYGWQADNIVHMKKRVEDLTQRQVTLRSELDERDRQLAKAHQTIKTQDSQMSSQERDMVLRWNDIEQRNKEIHSLLEQVQLLTQQDDRAKQDVESQKQELRLSQMRENQTKTDMQAMADRCAVLEAELRQTRANQADGKAAAASPAKPSDDLKVNSLLLQLEQAKLKATEFEKFAKSSEMEKEHMREDLEVQKRMVRSLTAQVKELEWEYGKVPNGSNSASPSSTLIPRLTAQTSFSLSLESTPPSATDRERAEHYQMLALDAQRDRQEVYVLFTSKIIDYDIVKMVAHGCEGAVYLVRCKKARLPDPSKLFALKVMFNIFQMESVTQIRRAFQNEYELLAMLPPHPNVTRLCAFFFDRIGKSLPDLPPEVRERARSMSLFIVLEYVPLNLESVCLELRVNNRITVMKLIDWAFQIAEALYFLAAHNVVHRDMKLNNVLVTDDGVVKICDFGCAVRLDDASMKLKLFPNMPKGGNPAHLAPEVLNAEFGSSADMYCDYSKQPVFELGVMIFEMLQGVSPFKKLDQRGYNLAGVPRLDISRLCYPPQYSRDAMELLASDLQSLQQRLVEFDVGKRLSIADMHSSLMSLQERAKSLQSPAATAALQSPAAAAAAVRAPAEQLAPATPSKQMPPVTRHMSAGQGQAGLWNLQSP